VLNRRLFTTVSRQDERITNQLDELKGAYDRLKEQDVIKDEFINIAAHELRTPVLPIMLSAENLAENSPNDDNAKIILRNANRLTKLTNDILDVSKIESGNISYKMDAVRINEVILDVVNSQKTNLKAGVQVQMHCDATNNVTIEADRNRLSQVFTNIIGNAMKFTKEGFIRVETRLSWEVNGLDIIISDSGPGIMDEVLPNLFGKFVTKGAGTENYQGTGLGLFISKSIVAAHGGRISGRNGEKGGAVFEITLPLTQDKKGPQKS
jgi:signal transduction histidine kinase